MKRSSDIARAHAAGRYILAALLFIIIFSVYACASDAVADGSFGTRVSFSVVPIDDEAEEPKYLLKIDGEGGFDGICADGTKLTYDTRDASVLAEYASGIVEVEIGDGITKLGNYALAFLENLRSVTIPSTLTSLGNATFEGDALLEEIKISGKEESGIIDLSSIKSIGSYTFSGCISISEILFSDELSGSVGTRTFNGCLNLGYLEFPIGIKTVNSGFIKGCSALRYVSFAGEVSFASGAFEDAPSSFYVCAPEGGRTASYVTELGVRYGGDDPSGIPYAPDPDAVDSGICGDMLFWQIKMISDFDPESPKYELFIYGEGEALRLTDIYGRNVDYNTVKSSGYAKYGDAVVRAEIGESVRELGNYSFARMGALREVVLPSAHTKIGSAVFEGCTALESVRSAGSETEVGVLDLSGVSSFGQYAFDGCGRITSVVFSDSLDMKEFGRECFKKAGLTSIVIPESIKKISEKAFDGCTALTEVKFLGDTTISADAFSGCNALTRITAASGGDAEALADELGIEFIAPIAIAIRRAADRTPIENVEVITGESLKSFTFGGRIYLPYFDEDCTRPYSGEAFTETTTLYVSELFSLDGVTARLDCGEDSSGFGVRARFRLDSSSESGNSVFEVAEVGAIASRERAGARIPLTLDMKRTFAAVFVSDGKEVSSVCSIPLGEYKKFALTAVGFEDENGELLPERCTEELCFRGYVILKNKRTGDTLTLYTDMQTVSLSSLRDDVPRAPKKSATASELISDIEAVSSSGEKLVCVKPDIENIDSIALAIEEYYNENGAAPDILRLDHSSLVSAGLTSDAELEKLIPLLCRYAKNGGRLLLVHRPANPCSESGGSGGKLNSSEAKYVLDAETAQGQKYLSELGSVGKLAQLLKDRGVPLMLEFAPDISSKWYWWCNVDADEEGTGEVAAERYISLWRYTFGYLKGDCGLDNLISLYRGGTNEEDFYPGADHVDIFGKDFIK